MIVIAKEIEHYPDYEITEDGKVISYKWGYPHPLSIRTDMKGYKDVLLCGRGKPKRFKVHRLVAAAFIPNPMNKPQVNHLDGDKANNNVSNLEWATHEENMAHAVAMGLTWNYSGSDHYRWNPARH